jgi:hypothetical protein
VRAGPGDVIRLVRHLVDEPLVRVVLSHRHPSAASLRGAVALAAQARR